MSRPYAAKLQELLQASYNLPNAFCELGRIQLGPAEIEDATHGLYEHDKAGIDAKAHYLLAASGFNAEQVLRDIAQLKVAKKEQFSSTVSQGAPAAPRATKPASADPAVAASVRKFDEFLARHVARAPLSTERTVAIAAGADAAVPTTAAALQPPLPAPPAGLSPAMRAYGQVVTALCDARFEMPDLAERFAAAARSSGAGQSTIDCWAALGADSPSAFLEQQFREVMDAEISARRQGARLGGVPSPMNKVQAYVALKHRHNGSWDRVLTLVNKTPVWAYLYFLVRAGHTRAALQLVLERRDIFESAGSTFAAHFQAWAAARGSLAPTAVARVQSEYRQLFRPGVKFDPYKHALYKIIGRCDVAVKSVSVAPTAEDWLWTQLQLVQPDSAYTLADLRALVLAAGSAPFSAHQYCTMLLLLGLHSDALAFLKDKDPVLGVHIALCLVARRALPAASTEAFSAGVERYTELFRNAAPSLAVDYLATLALAASGPQQVYTALQNVVLETRHFSDLVGDRTAFTHEVVPGAIEKRLPLVMRQFPSEKANAQSRAAFLASVPRPAARRAQQAGRVVDAVLLYRLAGDEETVLRIVCAQLGVLLGGAQLGAALDDEMLRLARNLVAIDAPSSPQAAVLAQLLDVAACFDVYAKGEWLVCLDRVTATGLVALGPTAEARELSEQFALLDESVRKCVPKLLVMAMTCIVRLTAQRPDVQYKSRAGSCMLYAGLIQYRMPREVFQRLIELEAQV